MSEHRNDSASRTSLLRKRLKFYITVTRWKPEPFFLKQLRIIIVKISDIFCPTEGGRSTGNAYFQGTQL